MSRFLWFTVYNVVWLLSCISTAAASGFSLQLTWSPGATVTTTMGSATYSQVVSLYITFSVRYRTTQLCVKSGHTDLTISWCLSSWPKRLSERLKPDEPLASWFSCSRCLVSPQSYSVCHTFVSFSALVHCRPVCIWMLLNANGAEFKLNAYRPTVGVYLVVMLFVIICYLSSSSSSSLKFLEWPKQQRHHEDHYSQSKYEQYQTVL